MTSVHKDIERMRSLLTAHIQTTNELLAHYQTGVEAHNNNNQTTRAVVTANRTLRASKFNARMKEIKDTVLDATISTASLALAIAFSCAVGIGLGSLTRHMTTRCDVERE